MRMSLSIIALALGLIAVPPASATALGTIEGSILDRTCFGPCAVDMEPVPYTGEATVVITRLNERRRVRMLIPEPHGTFVVRLPKGRYRLEVRIEDPCFIEDERVLRLSAHGDHDGPEFFVSNGCIQ